MNELDLIVGGGIILVALAIHVYTKIRVGDWQHPKLSDDWEPTQSRGRIRGRHNDGV